MSHPSGLSGRAAVDAHRPPKRRRPASAPVAGNVTSQLRHCQAIRAVTRSLTRHATVACRSGTSAAAGRMTAVHIRHANFQGCEQVYHGHQLPRVVLTHNGGQHQGVLAPHGGLGAWFAAQRPVHCARARGSPRKTVPGRPAQSQHPQPPGAFAFNEAWCKHGVPTCRGGAGRSTPAA